MYKIRVLIIIQERMGRRRSKTSPMAKMPLIAVKAEGSGTTLKANVSVALWNPSLTCVPEAVKSISQVPVSVKVQL
jgi:hypothetical protein